MDSGRTNSQLVGLVVLCYCCFFAQLSSTVARLYTRIVLLRNFGLDDALVAVACLLCIAALPMEHVLTSQYRCAITRTLNNGGPNGLLNPCGGYQVAMKLEWVLANWYIIVVTLLKLSILAFYRRFLPARPYGIYVLLLALFTLLFGTATFFATLLRCLPFRWLWEKGNIGRCKVNGFQLGVAVGYFNLVTDVIILLMPVAVVSQLNIDPKRRYKNQSVQWLLSGVVLAVAVSMYFLCYKVALIGLFSLGLVGTIVTALRVWKATRVEHDSRSQRVGSAAWIADSTQSYLLSYIEVSIICTCANAPALAAWWKRHGASPSSITPGDMGGSGNSGSGGGLRGPAHKADDSKRWSRLSGTLSGDGGASAAAVALEAVRLPGKAVRLSVLRKQNAGFSVMPSDAEGEAEVPEPRHERRQLHQHKGQGRDDSAV